MASSSHGQVFRSRIRDQWTEQLGRRLDVLIAGCGRGPDLEIERVDVAIAGVDEDLLALRLHTESRRDLVSWKLGDLRGVPLPPRSCDVVISEFLLHRIQHAELVLDRIVGALRPGGLLLLRIRDGQSAYGFCARRLPKSLRALLWPAFVPPGEVGPLPAIYNTISSRDGIHSYCLMRGLMIAEEYAGRSGAAYRGRFAGLVESVCGLVSRLSRGRLNANHDEIMFVIRKPQNHFARLI